MESLEVLTRKLVRYETNPDMTVPDALIRGNAFFEALRQAVQDRTVTVSRKNIEAFRERRDKNDRANPAGWVALKTMFICAEIAALHPADITRLRVLLEAIDKNAAALPGFLSSHTASLDEKNWLPFVREQLYKLTWPQPLSAAWGWDVVARLSGQPRTGERSVSISTLLIVQNAGVIGKLTLELLPHEGPGGIFYPDPETMWCVSWDKEFTEGLRNALDTAKAIVGGDPQANIRWKIVRRDGKALSAIKGGSAGAAFALALAKLFAQDQQRIHGTPSDVVNALDDIELGGVAATAVVDGDGSLHRIEGAYEKLRSACDRVLGIDTVVMAEDQRPEIFSINPEVLKPDSDFYVICATTLAEAVNFLHEEHGPRAAIRRYELEASRKLEIIGNTVSEVSTESHYQVLPLLREIKKEKLPRESPGDKARNEKEDARSGLRAGDIIRWEEENLRQEQVTYEKVELKRLFHDYQAIMKEAATKVVPRLIITGPPGSGKTTLERYMGWQVAGGQWRALDKWLIPVRIRLREWERWAETKTDNSLAGYLKEYYGTKNNAAKLPTQEQWERWLQRGDVLLLLDGLDEIAGRDTSFVESLRDTLGYYKDCPFVITCRTVSYEQHRSLFHDLPVFLLSGLDDAQRDAFITSYPAFSAKGFDAKKAKKLIDQLNHTPQMRPLAANPLLLSLICYAADDGGPVPTTRCELYDKVVNKLLLQPWRVKTNYPITEILDRKRRLLEDAAFTLFASMGANRQLTFKEGDIVDALTGAAMKIPYGDNSGSIADALFNDLKDNSGILRGSPEEGYFFLHLTIQEYLAASALARVMNSGELESEIEIGGNKVTVSHLIDKKSWDPRWQEVVVLFAGQLGDPLPLLNLLANEKQDDYFRHRLSLAALCLPEIPAQTRNSFRKMVNEITSTCFSSWWGYKLKSLDAAVGNLTRALPALTQVNEEVMDRLIQFLDDADEDSLVHDKAEAALGIIGSATPIPKILKHLMRSGAVTTLGGMGSAAATPEVLQYLINKLYSDLSPEQNMAVGALRNIGSAAPSAAFLLEITNVFDEREADCNENLRERKIDLALGILIIIGSAAFTPMVQKSLIKLLSDEDWLVRARAAEALGGIGSAPAIPEVLDCLTKLLSDESSWVRFHAAEALGKIDSAPALAEALDSLIKLLSDKSLWVRIEAAKALGEIGSAAAIPEALDSLIKLLSDEDSSVRAHSAEALGEIGSAAAIPEVLDGLVKLLSDEDWEVPIKAAIALRKISSVPDIEEETPDRLIKLLSNESAWVRTHAAIGLGKIGSAPALAEALGEIGSAAAIAEAQDCLIKLLSDEDWGVRSTAAHALGKIGSAAAIAEAQDCLIKLLSDEDSLVRIYAAMGLGEIGSAPAIPEVLDGLVKLLSDENSSVRIEAAGALGKLCSPPVIPNIMNRMIESFLDGRTEAANVLKTFGEQGVRILKIKGELQTTNVETLSQL